MQIPLYKLFLVTAGRQSITLTEVCENRKQGLTPRTCEPREGTYQAQNAPATNSVGPYVWVSCRPMEGALAARPALR